MAKNRQNRKSLEVPVEKQTTAAWANIESTKNASNVTQPSDLQVVNAKEYADENEK